MERSMGRWRLHYGVGKSYSGYIERISEIESPVTGKPTTVHHTLEIPDEDDAIYVITALNSLHTIIELSRSEKDASS